MLIETLQEYIKNRYKPLEIELLNKTNQYLSKDKRKIHKYCLNEWKKAMGEACKIQESENIDCAYMSISLLNTSMIDNKPQFQVDFYNEEWVYGEAWARYRMSADFLFKYWQDFIFDALDESYYVRSKISRVEIKAMFWGTIEQLIYLFACHLKYFARYLSYYNEFDDLVKAEKFYVTCGTYLDWQERVFAVLPEIDFFNLDANEQTPFRTIRNKIYHCKEFKDIEMQHCLFVDCKFDHFNFENINLSDAIFLRCRFTSSKLINVMLVGCEFFECYFKDCELNNCNVNPNSMSEIIDEYFAPTKMYHCFLLNFKTENVEMENVIKINCFEKND